MLCFALFVCGKGQKKGCSGCTLGRLYIFAVLNRVFITIHPIHFVAFSDANHIDAFGFDHSLGATSPGELDFIAVLYVMVPRSVLYYWSGSPRWKVLLF